MKNSVILTEDSNYAAIAIESWDQFLKESGKLSKTSIINGLKYFFLKGECDAEAVFSFINSKKESVTWMWREMHFGGDLYEAYFADSLRKDFRTKHENNDAMLELYACYLTPLAN